MKIIDFLKKGKTFVVAELSANHNGSLKIAVQTIRAAAKAGADAIKLQTYTPETMTIDSKKNDFIIKNGSIWDGDNYFDLYKKAFTPWEWHEELFKVAKEEGLICFSTPFDKTSVDFLENLGNPIYKIASFEITDIPLIDYIASKGKPIIISTGIAKKSDINLALKTIRRKNSNEIVLLKCTSSYPAPLNEANLLTLTDYANTFGVIPGLSDHTLGITAPVVATVLGARVIEKHFILDKSIGGPDSSFSLDFNEFSEMVKAVRSAESSIGSINYNLSEKQKLGKSFSRSLYIVEDVKKGDIISEKNVRSIRPGFGLHPKFLYEILGKKFKDDFLKGTRLTLKKIEK
jgi:pseudaminic acid synthase